MMEYQVKHKEACAKFESIEEEHLAQMVTFTIQLASALEANVTNVDKVRTILPLIIYLNTSRYVHVDVLCLFELRYQCMYM